LTIISTTRPDWIVLENVESIDHEGPAGDDEQTLTNNFAAQCVPD